MIPGSSLNMAEWRSETKRGEKLKKKKYLMNGLPLWTTGTPPTGDLLGDPGGEDAAGYLSTISYPSLVERCS